MTRVLFKIIVAAASAFIASVAALYWMQDTVLFPAPGIDIPTSRQDAFQKVIITTPDGENLYGLHRTVDGAQMTIIMFHGNGDSVERLVPKGQFFANAGFNVLLAEYRGYPGSTGSPSQDGLFTDGLAAYDFVERLAGGEIAIHAHSLGTAVAVHTASKRDVQAMVLEAPFDSILAIAERRFPWVPVSLLLKHPFRSDEYISSVTAPILMLHGDRDRVIPLSHGQALFGVAPGGSVFETINGAGHNNLDSFGVAQRAVAFFRKIAGPL